MVVPHVTDDEGGLLRVPSDLPLDNGRSSARRRFGAGTEVKLQSVGGGSGAGHEGSGQQDDEAWEGRFHGAMPFLWPERGEKASGISGSSSHYGRSRVFVAHFVEALCRAVLKNDGFFDKVADKVCRQSLPTKF